MNTPVKFEIAKLLKEKGYDRKTSSCYYKDGDEEINSYLIYYGSYKEDLIESLNSSDKNIYIEGFDYNIDNSRFSAPTIAEVITWLYEKHEIWISVYQYKDHAADVNDDFVFRSNVTGNKEFTSPTEAYESAIEYTLKTIKIK